MSATAATALRLDGRGEGDQEEGVEEQAADHVATVTLDSVSLTGNLSLESTRSLSNPHIAATVFTYLRRHEDPLCAPGARALDSSSVGWLGSRALDAGVRQLCSWGIKRDQAVTGIALRATVDVILPCCPYEVQDSGDHEEEEKQY